MIRVSDGLRVANYFLELAASEGRQIDHLKLQKLVYIAHGALLGYQNQKLIEDELFEAWKYGPVLPSLYHEFKRFGSGEVPKPLVQDSGVQSLTQTQKEAINDVWEVYRDFTGPELTRRTHSKDSPWYQVAQAFGDDLENHLTIPTQLIKEYWSNFLSSANEVA